MIRKFHPEDMDKVMEIWLFCNFRTHHFISKKYWEKNYDEVKSVFSLASVYVSEDDGEITGFIADMDDYVVAHFVKESARRKGIGKALLDQAKKTVDDLTLSVYEKNLDAIKFYMREGFDLQTERVDESTGEWEMVLEWKSTE
jgi:putative acetyltransferase